MTNKPTWEARFKTEFPQGYIYGEDVNVDMDKVKDFIKSVEKETEDRVRGEMRDFADWYHHGLSNAERGTVEEMYEKWKVLSHK